MCGSRLTKRWVLFEWIHRCGRSGSPQGTQPWVRARFVDLPRRGSGPPGSAAARGSSRPSLGTVLSSRRPRVRHGPFAVAAHLVRVRGALLHTKRPGARLRRASSGLTASRCSAPVDGRGCPGQAPGLAMRRGSAVCLSAAGHQVGVGAEVAAIGGDVGNGGGVLERVHRDLPGVGDKLLVAHGCVEVVG
jgi:hypothetical protein